MIQNTTLPSELVHYGVKGMHWGVRKSTPTNSSYSTSQQQHDKNNYGKSSVKRINRRLNKGVDLQAARKQESKTRARRRTAIGLGILFGPQIARGAQVIGTLSTLTMGVAAQSVATRAETNRGRAAAANTMGLPRMGTSGPTFAKKNRSGVHKITSI